MPKHMPKHMPKQRTHSQLHSSRRALSVVFAVAFAAVLWQAVAQSAFAQSTVAPRKMAPGVLVTILPEIEPDETVSTHDIVEIRADANLRWEPKLLSDSRILYGQSKDAKFRRKVWALEFSFKPLRMVEVGVPQSTGETQQKQVWYLVYQVKNIGKMVRPLEQDDDSFAPQPAKGEPVRFIPHMVLEGQDRSDTGQEVYRAYLDQVIPAAVAAIARRETPGRPLLNSAEMAEQLLPLSNDRTGRGVWGVATWQDIDPRIDFLSVFVSGLTNAYQWFDPPGAYQVGGPAGQGRRFARKTLQLNFWRPGDQYLQNEREVRYGVPRGKAHLYDVPEGVAYTWVYR